ncbi:leucyl aminopeptidase [Buchnera aphidicola (Macrosiphoniella sanborni)]|uniref:Probable cytosol aminopeptidase n=1 Tax=Buchnera aphidicola (Macrosiphoniella sanborni) TaxID=1241865 RepID=A0A4D6Y2Z5_9GAMM|nr:leucyl aminopeptidase [Buchnera aphidicola]QCI23896.1 leucyl aminopeptidase [Buchnera aphidicola (Macrosiphoniella sanborni)]
MNFFIKNSILEKEQTDCIVIAIFESCQLSDSANYLDKCSNHYITSLLQLNDIQGKIGDTLILYNIPNVISKRILLIGCGKKNELNKSNFKKIIKNSVEVLNKCSIKNVIYSVSELIIDIQDNIYWIVRCLLLSIRENTYKICKINSFKKNDVHHLYQVTINILIEHDLYNAQVSLKHALAISDALISAKNLSNLPPNICNPLYLANEAQKLHEKYPQNITVEVINVEEMKKLGMHAYVSVGNGSKNKPFMSVVKYSRKNSADKKIIALIGKGLTFDSGGISIKPSANMNYMKYDMCGAAAVYGTMIMAAELNLPLTIIGILSGCENMPSGQAFRPGDVLTTMSGKTVEILNTDAEGRLVLCDSLTYVRRFSPDIVIDIATLTGACVTALGKSISGLFSNNKNLEKQLYHASQQTDDKIWSLPLDPEYQKELTSHIADLNNTGTSSQAGAIIAACFLANFTKQYKWAHLDIAGTAWRSNKDKGATGRPVELLCQFLLNQSNFY